MNEYPEVLYQPPAGRPRWVNADRPGCELQYLSWGWRRFGHDPVPVSRHAGWTYQYIASGGAVLNVAGTPHPVRAGTMVIVAPSCPSGWNAQTPRQRSRILNWTWAGQPTFPDLRPDRTGFRLLSASPEVAKAIERLHEETRNEIRFSDEAALPALNTLRQRLDILLYRLLRRLGGSTDTRSQIRSALAWLRTHPEELRPVSALSDYLQVSPATLNRFFRAELDQSPREVAYALRMKAAKKLFAASSISVKELAFRLGYSHANDLTRAYTRFWGQAPTRKRR